MKRTAALFALLAASVGAHGQAPAPPEGVQVYTAAPLQLAMYFMEGVRPEAPETVGEYSYRARFAMHPADDPLHRGLDPCAPTILAVGTGPDRPIDAEHPLIPGKQTPLAPTGGISLAEIKPSCLAKDAPGRSQEEALGDYVDGIRHIKGIPSLSQPIDYTVQGRTVILATAGGPSKDLQGKRVASAGSTYLASIATINNGHLLLWSVTANDVSLFNQLLAMHVCFDAPTCKSGYERLVPFALQAGDQLRSEDGRGAVPR